MPNREGTSGSSAEQGKIEKPIPSSKRTWSSTRFFSAGRGKEVSKPTSSEVLSPADRNKQLEKAQNLKKSAMSSRDTGNLELAKRQFKESYDLHEQLNHPDTAVVYYEWALVYCDQKKFEQAAPLLKDGSPIDGWAQSLDNSEGAIIHNALLKIAADCNIKAEESYLKQDYKKASPLFEVALHIYEKKHGAEHSTTQGIRKRLANVVTHYQTKAAEYSNQRKFDKAEPLLKDPFHMCERVFGPRDPKTEAVRKNLYNLYNAWGKPTEATLYEPSQATSNHASSSSDRASTAWSGSSEATEKTKSITSQSYPPSSNHASIAWLRNSSEATETRRPTRSCDMSDRANATLSRPSEEKQWPSSYVDAWLGTTSKERAMEQLIKQLTQEKDALDLRIKYLEQEKLKDQERVQKEKPLRDSRMKNKFLDEEQTRLNFLKAAKERLENTPNGLRLKIDEIKNWLQKEARIISDLRNQLATKKLQFDIESINSVNGIINENQEINDLKSKIHFKKAQFDEKKQEFELLRGKLSEHDNIIIHEKQENKNIHNASSDSIQQTKNDIMITQLGLETMGMGYMRYAISDAICDGKVPEGEAMQALYRNVESVYKRLGFERTRIFGEFKSEFIEQLEQLRRPESDYHALNAFQSRSHTNAIVVESSSTREV